MVTQTNLSLGSDLSGEWMSGRMGEWMSSRMIGGRIYLGSGCPAGWAIDVKPVVAFYGDGGIFLSSHCSLYFYRIQIDAIDALPVSSFTRPAIRVLCFGSLIERMTLFK
jgi:hypothetical protein